MAKRKRDEHDRSNESPEPSTDRSIARRKKRCAQCITAAQQPLLSALRLAAGFERQKHSRRRKTAQANNDIKALSRLYAEYAVMKQLDLAKIAEQHLRKTIGRVKSLRESEALPESINDIEKGHKDVAVLNVQARLCKVDAVRKAVDEAIDQLKEIVGADPKPENTRKQRKFKSKETEEDDSETAVSDLESKYLEAFSARVAAPSSADEESEDSLPAEQRPPSVVDSESEDEEDDELDSTAYNTGPLPFYNFNSEEEVDVSETSTMKASELESSSDSDGVAVPLPKLKRKHLMPEDTSKSTFFTLGQAAYISGSDSEASDLDAEFAPRKNRRGQRARQKIWEQKHGEKAKHLQSQERSKGWDPKRGAVSDHRGRKGEQYGRRGTGPEKTGANAGPLGPKKTKRDDTGSLHPSWQAAKMAKEKKVDMKPQGKKIVFD